MPSPFARQLPSYLSPSPSSSFSPVFLSSSMAAWFLVVAPCVPNDSSSSFSPFVGSAMSDLKVVGRIGVVVFGVVVCSVVSSVFGFLRRTVLSFSAVPRCSSGRSPPRLRQSSAVLSLPSRWQISGAFRCVLPLAAKAVETTVPFRSLRFCWVWLCSLCSWWFLRSALVGWWWLSVSSVRAVGPGSDGIQRRCVSP